MGAHSSFHTRGHRSCSESTRTLARSRTGGTQPVVIAEQSAPTEKQLRQENQEQQAVGQMMRLSHPRPNIQHGGV